MTETAIAVTAARATLQAIQLALADGGDLVDALTSASERRLLQAAALPRRFNRDMVDCVLGPASRSDGAAFDRLLGLDAVQALPGRAGWFRMDDTRRARLVDVSEKTANADADADALLPGSRRWRDLHQALAQCFEDLGGEGELEALYHRLSLGDSAAQARWQTLYAEARDRFDLARCESLLDLLQQRTRHLTPELASLLTRERGLLAARAAFADDYFRTGSYLERSSLLQAFEALSGDGEPFILQLHAPGGSGKTMFLRWLGARWCLARGIPIARVDFDFLDESERASAPAFLLGKLAERLDPQLLGAPFFELLRDVAEERRRLLFNSAASAANALPAEALQQRLGKLEAEVRERFARTLVERCASMRVVLVFDTLEDATLKHQIDLLAVVRAVAALRTRVLELAGGTPGAAPRLILILSGRYTLEEQYPLVHASFAAQVVPVAVTPFTVPDESTEYLQRRLSGISTTPQPQVIAAIVQRAQGNPFKLSLYADILLATPQMGLDELGQVADVDLLYLIERVLKRLPDSALRWLLRYGVLARRLTLGFVGTVLLRAMRRQLRGDTTADNPEEDGVQHKDWLRLWQASDSRNATKLVGTDLWQRLQAYASSSSWIDVDPRSGDALIIQPVVRQPMRRTLLQRHRPVVEQIHRAAINAARSGADTGANTGTGPRSLAQRMADQTFHEFQWRGAAAAQAWRRRLHTHESDGAVLGELASVVLSDDLQDADMPAWVSARAHFVLAQQHQLRSIDVSPDEAAAAEQRLKARSELAQFDAVAVPAGEPTVSLVEQGRLRAVLSIDRDERVLALQQLEAALATRLDPHTRAGVLLELSRARVLLGDERASRFGQQWGRLARRMGDAESYVEWLQSDLTQLLLRAAPRQALRQWQGAMDELKSTNTRWSSAGDAIRARRRLAEEEARLLQAAGLPALALQRFDRLVDRRMQTITVAEHSEAQLRYAELQCDAAEAGIARDLAIAQGAGWAKATPGADHSATFIARQRIRLAVTLSHAARHLLDFSQALDAMAEAMSLLAGIGDHLNAMLTRLYVARVQLFDIGNLRQAAEHLQDSDDALAGEAVELRVEHLLLRAALRRRLGDAANVQRLLNLARQWVAEVPAQRWRIRLHVAMGEMAGGDDATRVSGARALAETLAGIDCVGARLLPIRELRQIDAVPGLPKAIASQLERLSRVRPLRLPGLHKLLPADRARLTMQRAELLRIIGAPERAADDLRALAPMLKRLPAAPWMRELALCCDRLHISPAEVLPESSLSSLISHNRRARLFCAALRAESAARAARAGEPKLAQRLLRPALKELDRSTNVPAHWQLQACELQLQLLRAQPVNLSGVDAAALQLQVDALRARLGWPREAAANVPPTRAAPAATRPAAPRIEPAAAQGLSIVEADAVLRVNYLANGTTQEGRRTPIARPFCDMLTEFGAGRFSEKASWDLISLMGLPDPGFGRALGDAVLPELMQMRLQATEQAGPDGAVPPMQLLLEHRQPGMHAMPWELMVPQLGSPLPLTLQAAVGNFWRAPFGAGLRPRIAWAQSALQRLGQGELIADGRLGPASERALRRWQERQALPPLGLTDTASITALHEQLLAQRLREGVPPLSVLLIKPSRDVEAASQRGSSTAGADIEGIYRDIGTGTHVDVLDEPHLDRLRELMKSRPWSVIHIAAPIAQSRTSRELSLQFAARSEDARTTAFGPSLLARALRGSLAEQPPLVIVETPRSTSRDETIRQLLCRNAFAAELFYFSELPVVMAIGLVQAETQQLYTQTLANLLAQHATPARVMRALREMPAPGGPPNRNADPVSMLGHTAVALFARDPLVAPLIAMPERSAG